MAAEDNYREDDRHHLRRDVRDAYNDAKAAKLLATLAIIGAAIALAVALNAINKASDALNNVNRMLTNGQSQ
jgi:hypothetical protein